MNVVELRRYVLKPNRREELITLFERHFIESQERCGMVPVGHYRDLGDPQGFVWLREFAGMEQRRSALEAFYLQSPEWLEHRDAANATMIDSDNVLLLRPARDGSGVDLRGLQRPAAQQHVAPSYAAIAIFMLERAPDCAAIRAFETQLLGELQHGARRVAYFVSEERPNDFPRLPVREREPAFVVTGVCTSLEEIATWVQRLESSHLPKELRDAVVACEHLRLEPAARSLYR
ncbi:MAG TPA: NIPSNAP family protein [Candidatus Baltobacteraceae bacterium]|nr:NIPSNAP family protein [Candidatus Baltobacteraceae bacterium]